MVRLALAATVVLILGACGKAIGDNCSSSGECDSNGFRACDTASPGGYCTVLGCDPGTCPSEAACVEFLYQEPRSTRRFCMRQCQSGGCRAGYVCADVRTLGEGYARIVETSAHPNVCLFPTSNP